MPQGPNELYGQTGAGSTDRFAVAGDPRRMYPILAAGGLKDIAQPPHKLVTGSLYSLYTGAWNLPNTTSPEYPSLATTDVFGCQNLISNGEALYGIGTPTQIGANIFAVRLGVSGAVGGNDMVNSPAYCYCQGWDRQTVTTRLVFNGGEVIKQNTNAGTNTYGAYSEQFTTAVAGTVTFSSASTSIQGNGTTFTTASIQSAANYPGYHGNLPSKALLSTGDIIRLTNGAGTFSYHRIVSVNAAAGAGALTVYPATIFAGAATAFTLFRTGYIGSYSRIVGLSIGTNPTFYWGGRSRIDAGNQFDAIHFSAPQTTAGGANVADLPFVQDIAYFKSFLLYMTAGGTIGWSVAGFPTSGFAAPYFGADDFPSINVNVQADRIYTTFEYLGDQLIALSTTGLLQIQATGTVPEFQFYPLPEPTGVYMNFSTEAGFPIQVANRPSCSGRNAIFYWSRQGLMMFTGGVAECVSLDVNEPLMRQFQNTSPGLQWEPTTDSVVVCDPTQNVGFIYNVPTKTWSYLNMNAYNGFTPPLMAFGGDIRPQNQSVAGGFYNSVSETLYYWDSTPGGPFVPGSANFAGAPIWQSPVVSLGDAYGGVPVAGFQFDGISGAQNATYTLFTGRVPWSMHADSSGTIQYLDNRRLLGGKIDDAFVSVQLSFPGATLRPVIVGVNLYPYGRGK